MGILQKFVSFTEALDAEKRKDVETVMSRIMQSYADDVQLTPEQEAEDDRRFNDPTPKYVTQTEVEATCGRSMPS